jgi:molybdopterin/thiamine biosynthesis adenylyltransferase
LLSSLTVGVIGAGGVGSLTIEQLARLGVGHLVIVDPDRIEVSNLSRVVGATRWDARGWFASEDRPGWMRTLARRWSTPKVKIAERVVRQANPATTVETIFGDFTEDVIARRFVVCDYIFLAANSHLARLVFNAIVHQYYVPGVQIGTKIPIEKETGAVGEIFSTARPLTPGEGCLDCNGYISAQKLEEESIPAAVLRRQRYVDGEDVPAPSVITLNATAVGWATNDFLMTMLVLHQDEGAHAYVRFLPRRDELALEEVRRDLQCTECGADGRVGRGDTRALPARRGASKT